MAYCIRICVLPFRVNACEIAAGKPPMSRKAQKPIPGLGQRLKDLRDAKDKTQPELAHELGFAPGTVSRWERGESDPQAGQLLKLAEYFSVTLDFLLRGVPAEEPIMTDVFWKFMGTAAGRWAQEHGLVPLLRNLKHDQPLTVEMYRGIVNTFRDAAEAALDASSAASNDEPPKTPTKT
jgi:transcriptional regulator with XRE-family HTH domain